MREKGLQAREEGRYKSVIGHTNAILTQKVTSLLIRW